MSALEEMIKKIQDCFSPSGFGGATNSAVNEHQNKWQLLIYFNPEKWRITDIQQKIQGGNTEIDLYLQQNQSRLFFIEMPMAQDYALSFITGIQDQWQLAFADACFYLPRKKLTIKALNNRTRKVENTLLIPAIEDESEEYSFDKSDLSIQGEQVVLDDLPEATQISYNQQGVYLKQKDVTLTLKCASAQNFKITKADDIYTISPSNEPFVHQTQIQSEINKIELTHIVLESVYCKETTEQTTIDQYNQTYHCTKVKIKIENAPLKYVDFYQKMDKTIQDKDIYSRFFKHQQIIQNNRIYRCKGLPLGIVDYDKKGKITQITRLGDKPLAYFFEKEQQKGILIGIYVFKLTASSTGFWNKWLNS